MRVHVRPSTCLTLLLILLLLAPSRPAAAYSLLTHEQLIDLTWDKSIVPLLKSRYPTLTPAEIEHARAYAYGGCVIQDIGYYPFGDPVFSDLTHYVRSGDFVVNLFRNAGNADELAFAIGALSHYIGDSIGHSTATNIAVPVEFPKLAAKYGKTVNYAQGEHEHVQTEFAFDIDQIAQHRFAPVHYLRHVGLEVPIKQLTLAFYQTYGLREDFQKTRGQRINVGAYRFAVHRLIPRVAYAETLRHRKQEPMDPDNDEVKALNAAVAAIAKENDWDSYRRKPGLGTHLLAGLIAVIPKVGRLKILAVKGPTPETEAEYIHSLTLSENALNGALHRFTPPPAPAATAAAAAADDKHSEPAADAAIPARLTGAGLPNAHTTTAHPLANRDLDTGNPVKPAGYPLTDRTYATLTRDLTQHPTDAIPPDIKTDILTYYADLSLPFDTKNDPARWAALQHDLDVLRGMPTSKADLAFETYDENAPDAPTGDAAAAATSDAPAKPEATTEPGGPAQPAASPRL